MKKFKLFVTLPLLVAFLFISNYSPAQDFNYSYALISITGKTLSNKLIVEVDLGDSPDQLIEGEKLSKLLTNKESHASILNYMSGLGFELVETMVTTNQHNGDGGTSGFVFIMRKKG
jgi:hypothetical protein